MQCCNTSNWGLFFEGYYLLNCAGRNRKGRVSYLCILGKHGNSIINQRFNNGENKSIAFLEMRSCWFQPVCSPLLSESSFSMSRFEMEKSNNFEFSIMRSLWEDFGKGSAPCCRHHLSIICAADLPYRMATSARAASPSILPRVRGEYASSRRFFLLQKSRSSFWNRNGENSTWLTAGGIFEICRSASKSGMVKLLTPIEAHMPSEHNFSSVFQVERLWG